MIPAFILTAVEGLVGPKFAKPLIYAVALLLAIGLFFGAKAIYDHKIIAAHDDKQDAANANADKKADDNSADQRVTDVTRLQNESTQTQEAINEARRNGSDPRAAYYDCVRKQQSARRAGQPSPAC
jgi:uncharacterized protein HemX